VRGRIAARPELAGVVALMVADVAWGAGNVFVKLAQMPAVSFAFYRLWLGFLVLGVICVAARRRVAWRDVRASVPGGIGFGSYMILLYAALHATNVADVTIIGALQPVLVMLVAGRLFGERFGGREVGLAVVATGGVVLVVLGSSGTPAWTLRGDLLAVLALLAFTGFWLASKHARSNAGVDTLAYVTIVALIGSLLATPATLAIGHGLPVPTGSDWLWLALTVALPGTLAHFLGAWAQRRVEVWRSSLVQLGVPVVGVAIAWVALNEPLTPLAVAGGAVVLLALAAVIGATRPSGGSGAPVEDEPTV